MLVLITYDICVATAEDRRRLRRVAKECVNHGQRVQNSVFECSLDATQLLQMQHRLEALIDKEKDSLRFYNLGNHYASKVVHLGCKAAYDPEQPMIL